MGDLNVGFISHDVSRWGFLFLSCSRLEAEGPHVGVELSTFDVYTVIGLGGSCRVFVEVWFDAFKQNS
ncbi:MAG: hypothetical protein ACKESB_01155 [Candidatus Hodgkinia cicadicola]